MVRKMLFGKSQFLIDLYLVPVAKVETAVEQEHPERVRRSPNSPQTFMAQMINNGTEIVDRIATAIKEKLGTNPNPGKGRATFNSMQ